MRAAAISLLCSLTCCFSSPIHPVATGGSGGTAGRGGGESGGSGGSAENGPRFDDASDCLAFGMVHLGEPKSLEAGVTNPGSSPVDVMLSTSGLPFAVVPTLHLDPGASQTVQVTFGPYQEGSTSGNLVLDCAGCAEEQRCLRGTGVLDRAHFDPLTLDFATRKDPVCLDLAVVNDGLTVLPVPFLSILSDPAQAFSIKDAPSTAVDPGGRATFQVCYQPGIRRTDSTASIQFRTAENGDALAIAALHGLSGWPQAGFSPGLVNTGIHMVGDSLGAEIIAGNIGQPAPLTVDQVELPADGTVVADIPPLPVDINDEPHFRFTATPKGSGGFELPVRFHVLEEDSWHNVPITGTLLSSPTCHLRIDPTELVLPFHVQGETTEESFSVFNEGATTCHPTDLSFETGSSPRYSFHYAGPPNFSMDPGGGYYNAVMYDPSVEFDGDDRATVRIQSKEGQTIELPVRLSSTYPCVTLDPRQDQLTAIEGSSASDTIRVGNCGTDDLVFEQPASLVGDPAEWTLDASPEAPFTIAPGATASFEVTFTPAWQYFRVTQLQLWPRGDDTPITVVLFGRVEGEP